MEQSMTNKPDELLPSATEVMQKIALAEAEEAEKQARMLAAAQASGRVHMMMFTWRWLAIPMFGKQLIDDGYIGHCREA